MKKYCEATLEDDFVDNEILFGVFPEYNEYEYTVDDFAEIGCVEVKQLSSPKEGKPTSRCMLIMLDKNSKENVLAMIKILEQRDDIRYAHSNYVMYIQTTANDPHYTSGGQWAINQIDLPAAWDLTTGESTVYVGVIDTGGNLGTIQSKDDPDQNRIAPPFPRPWSGEF